MNLLLVCEKNEAQEIKCKITKPKMLENTIFGKYIL